MVLSPDDPRPLFEQVAATLRERIASGDLAPGAQLPSTDALAGEFGVARNTVRNAIQLLGFEGLVVARHGSGVFVRVAVEPDAGPPLGEVLRAVRELQAGVDALLKRLGG